MDPIIAEQLNPGSFEELQRLIRESASARFSVDFTPLPLEGRRAGTERFASFTRNEYLLTEPYMAPGLGRAGVWGALCMVHLHRGDETEMPLPSPLPEPETMIAAVAEVEQYLRRRGRYREQRRLLDMIKLRLKLRWMLDTGYRHSRRFASLYAEADPQILIGCGVKARHIHALVMARMGLRLGFHLLTLPDTPRRRKK